MIYLVESKSLVDPGTQNPYNKHIKSLGIELIEEIDKNLEDCIDYYNQKYGEIHNDVVYFEKPDFFKRGIMRTSNDVKDDIMTIHHLIDKELYLKFGVKTAPLYLFVKNHIRLETLNEILDVHER